MLSDLLDRAEDIAAGAGAKGLRDKREPGRREKTRFEARYQAIVQRHFSRQLRRVQQWLAVQPPPKAAKATLPLSLDEALEYDDNFDAELLRLYQEVTRHGVSLFGATATFDIDYTLVNTEAAKWARSYVGELVKGIDDTTRQAVREAVAGFIETPGMTLGDVMQALPFDEGRAERVAVTEITRAYGETTRLAAEELKREFPDVRVTVRWETNNDDTVCDICGPLNGKEVNEGEPFTPAAGDKEAIYNPPAHVNCRCWASTRTRIDG
jgi:hypothetical protein